MTIQDIERMTEDYARERGFLLEILRDEEKALDRIRREYVPVIAKKIKLVKNAHAALWSGIEQNPHIFLQPKTFTFSDVRVGYQKGRGKISWENEERVLKCVKKYFPDRLDILIRTKETPNKDALAGYPARFLQECGIEILEAGDEVVVRPVDSEDEKRLNALLKEMEK